MLNNYTLTRLSTKEFDYISDLIYQQFGIKMPISKKTLLECRLQKRLRALELDDFKQYIDLLSNNSTLMQELFPMANVVTTNKTDFFRESGHFEFLKSLDWDHLSGGSGRGKGTLKCWSSACSSGEEPYTLSMVLNELGIDHHIYATDLSLDVLQKAVTAVYTQERTLPVPLFYKQKYFLKSKDPKKPLLRVVPEIRKKMVFKQLNLMDQELEVPHKMDIIFCRNVLIYFDRITQEKVIKKLCSHLKEGGYLFIGHSESISDFRSSLRQVKSTIYQKI